MPPHAPVPVKTPDGHAELAHRVRGLSQRHRTVLLLTDGRRTVDEVRRTAEAAGVPPTCFDELVAMGLISQAGTPPAVDHVDLPLVNEDSLLPAVRSLLPESEHGDVGEPLFPDAVAASDEPLEQAREMLIRAVRNEAPVTGSLTMMKLRRASTRDELEGLLDEVEQRIRKPRKAIINANLLRQVRHLLSQS